MELFQYRKRYGLHAISPVRQRTNDARERSFNTASGMDCMQWRNPCRRFRDERFQYRKRYGLHAIIGADVVVADVLVSIPQAVWIACNMKKIINKSAVTVFQYRKRYGLHAIHLAYTEPEGEPFQYRKRYGLHAIRIFERQNTFSRCFNTASGMDCMQFAFCCVVYTVNAVSIPQAVWIACNCTVSSTRNRFRVVSIPQAVWITYNGRKSR